MIVLNPEKTTGLQAYKVVMNALRRRGNETNAPVSKADFCVVADLSRNTLNDYRNGKKPGAEGLVKIACGLKAWGIESKIEI